MKILLKIVHSSVLKHCFDILHLKKLGCFANTILLHEWIDCLDMLLKVTLVLLGVVASDCKPGDEFTFLTQS